MPSHAVIGTNPFQQFSVGSSPTAIPIGTLEIPFNVTVAGNQFSFTSGGDVIIDLALNFTGVDSGRVAIVELFDATAGAVVVTNGVTQSFRAMTFPFQESSNEVIFALSPMVGDLYEIHITIPGAPNKANLATVQLARWSINSASVGGGTITGGGTINQLAKFTGPTSIGNSNLFDDGTTIVANASAAANPIFAAKGAVAQTGDLTQWQNSAGTVLSAVLAGGQIVIGADALFATEKLRVVGDARIEGKLTVTGAIDPTSLSLTGANNAIFVDWEDGQNVPISAAAHGRIRYNDATHVFEASMNGGAYVTISTGGGGVAFSAITSGINTIANMQVGNGAILRQNGTGTIGLANGVRSYAIGLNAGTSIGVASDCVLYGDSAGTSITFGTDDVCIGSSAGAAITTGTNNTFVGSHAGAASVTGGNNTLLGYHAGFLQAGASDSNNTFVGFQAGVNANGSANGQNTAVGSSAGATIGTGSFNTIVGKGADVGAAGANSAVALGRNAIAPDTGIVIGNGAGSAGITAANFIAIGAAAGANTTSGGNSVLIGTQAGISITTGSSNAIIGSLSGTALTTGGSNVFFGFTAGGSVTVGAQNTIIGSGAAATLTTGNTNVIIGQGADVATAATTSSIVIGAGSKGDGSAVIIAAAKVSNTANDLIIASGDTGISRNGVSGLLRVNQGTAAFASDGTIQASSQIMSGYTTTAVNYVVVLTDFIVYASAAGGNITVTIPLASANKGRIIVIKKSDATANSVTITNSGGDTIDGIVNRATTTQYTSFTLISDGVSNWSII